MSELPLDPARVAKIAKALRRPPAGRLRLPARRYPFRPEDLAITVHEMDSAALRATKTDVFFRREWVIFRDGVLNVLAGRGTGEEDCRHITAISRTGRAEN